jgi:hypothetical protein
VIWWYTTGAISALRGIAPLLWHFFQDDIALSVLSNVESQDSSKQRAAVCVCFWIISIDTKCIFKLSLVQAKQRFLIKSYLRSSPFLNS